MTLRLFVLFAIFAGIVGILTVQEEIMRLRAGYRLAKLAREHDEIMRRVARYDSEIAAMCRPDRLAQLNQEMKLGLRPLSSAAGETPPAVAAAPTR